MENPIVNDDYLHGQRCHQSRHRPIMDIDVWHVAFYAGHFFFFFFSQRSIYSTGLTGQERRIPKCYVLVVLLTVCFYNQQGLICVLCVTCLLVVWAGDLMELITTCAGSVCIILLLLFLRGGQFCGENWQKKK